MLWQYDPPFTLGFLRRNEVLFKVRLSQPGLRTNRFWGFRARVRLQRQGPVQSASPFASPTVFRVEGQGSRSEVRLASGSPPLVGLMVEPALPALR